MRLLACSATPSSPSSTGTRRPVNKRQHFSGSCLSALQLRRLLDGSSPSRVLAPRTGRHKNRASLWAGDHPPAQSSFNEETVRLEVETFLFMVRRPPARPSQLPDWYSSVVPADPLHLEGLCGGDIGLPRLSWWTISGQPPPGYTFRPRCAEAEASSTVPCSEGPLLGTTASRTPFREPDQQNLNCMCPVQALDANVHRAAMWRRADQLLVCYGPPKRGLPATKQTLSRWIVDAINNLPMSPLSSPRRWESSQVKSSHLYLYSAFNNTDCVKALNSIKLEDRVSVMYNNKIKHSIFS